MIRISQLRLPCGYAAGALENKIGKTLRMEGRSLTYTIVRHSVDARKKPQLFDTYTVDVDTGLGPGGEAAGYPGEHPDPPAGREGRPAGEGGG